MQNSTEQANKKTSSKLMLVAVGMFGFGFALVPLYDVMCDALGISSRFTDLQQAEQVTQSIDKDRTVKVEFVTTVNSGLNWEFRAMQSTVDVHPGEMKEVLFYARNLQGRDVIAQAVPSVVPPKAQKYFSKLECFCFNQQTFKAGEEKQMLLRFYVDPNIPKDVKEMSLSYTFFDTGRQTAQVSGVNNKQSAGL